MSTWDIGFTLFIVGEIIVSVSVSFFFAFVARRPGGRLRSWLTTPHTRRIECVEAVVAIGTGLFFAGVALMLWGMK